MLETIYKNSVVSFKRDKVNNIIFINCILYFSILNVYNKFKHKLFRSFSNLQLIFIFHFIRFQFMKFMSNDYKPF